MTQRQHAVAVVLAIGALLLAGCADAGDPEPTTPESAQPTAEVDRDPELAAQLAELIVEDLPPVSLRMSDDLVRDCGVDGGGCYSAEDATIYVNAEWTDFRRPELLAHEYLHHVWDRDGLGDDEALAAALDEAYLDDEGLGALVPPWQQGYVEDDGTILPTELFSYACTGLRPDQLADVVATRCAEYLRVDALPVNRSIGAGELLDELDRLREGAGLAPLERNTYAAAASEARAELFTPYAQAPLGEYPDSVRRHLDAGCAPAKYGARLTRPGDLAQQAQALDALLDGALTSSGSSGVGVAVAEFDYIDARELFGDRTIRVNATLVVATVCG